MLRKNCLEQFLTSRSDGPEGGRQGWQAIKKGALRRPCRNQRKSTLGEFRVGFHTAFGDVYAFVLFFLAHAQANHQLDDGPDYQAADEDPSEEPTDTQQLCAESSVALGQADSQQAPETAPTMYGDVTHWNPAPAFRPR